MSNSHHHQRRPVKPLTDAQALRYWRRYGRILRIVSAESPLTWRIRNGERHRVSAWAVVRVSRPNTPPEFFFVGLTAAEAAGPIDLPDLIEAAERGSFRYEEEAAA